VEAAAGGSGAVSKLAGLAHSSWCENVWGRAGAWTGIDSERALAPRKPVGNAQ